MKKRTLITQFVVAGSIALLSACGQKGPLFIPVKPIQSSLVEKPAQTSVTAPISSTKDAK